MAILLRHRVPLRTALALGALVTAACSSSSSSPAAAPTKTDAQYQADVTTGIQSTIEAQLTILNKAAMDLQAAAPTPKGRGWEETKDAAALTAMKEAWRRARLAYEHVEGAVAPIFPDIDTTIDARYDDFLSQLQSKGGDPYLFDDQGVTGMHAIERILYLKNTPASVVAFEKVLPGYVAQAYPATEQEAADFKNKLCVRFVTDSKTLLDQWTPSKIELATAFAGLVSLMNEQLEKVTKAATGEEESRYSQLTLADIHANLEGTQAAFGIFEPWVLSKTSADPTKDGPTIDMKIQAGFAALKTAYDANSGDAIPQPPASWSSESPSPGDLATPFGKLYTSVKTAVDPKRDGSVVFDMNAVADDLGFKRFQAP